MTISKSPKGQNQAFKKMKTPMNFTKPI